MIRYGWHLPIIDESAPTVYVPYSDLLAHYDEALKWMGAKVDVSKTRFQRYYKDIELFVRWSESPENTTSDLISLFNGREASGVNSIREARRLIEIHFSLKDVEQIDLVRRLERLRSGPELYYSENPANSSNAARDISFELFLAAKLRRRGYPVLLDDKSDITLDYGIGKVFIECKRPHSELEYGIEKARAKERDYKSPRIIKKGFEQLAIAIENSEVPAFGILAVSLEKILCPDDFVRFYSDYPMAYNGITAGFNNFQFFNDKAINSIPHRDIIGLLLYSSELCKIKDDIRTLDDFCLVRLGNDYEKGNGILDSLALNLVK